jgi:DNA-binding transcriptional LysR family regulator
MELRHLRYFIAVAEELNFRRAAERLHLAQPSLGRQICDLEEEIGERLFERDRKHVALTDAGRVLFAQASRLLAGASAAIQAARDAGRGARGTLHIGNIGVLTASFLSANLSAFRRQFPNVEIEIIELGFYEQVAALLAGRIQLGFQARNNYTPFDARFAERIVLTCGLKVVLPASHPLAGKSVLSVGSLAGQKLIDYEPRPNARYDEWVRAFCEKEGNFVPCFRRPPVANIEGLFGLVAAGEGLALLADVVAMGATNKAGLVVKRLRSRRPQFQVAAVWNPANPSVVLSNYLSFLSPTMGLQVKEPLSPVSSPRLSVQPGRMPATSLKMTDLSLHKTLSLAADSPRSDLLAEADHD